MTYFKTFCFSKLARMLQSNWPQNQFEILALYIGSHYIPSFSSKISEWSNKNWRRSAVFIGISAIWNFCNFWNSKQKFEIPALLQGGTICLVSPVKNSELSNKNCRRSSDLKQKLTDDGQISNTISSAELTCGSAELINYCHNDHVHHCAGQGRLLTLKVLASTCDALGHF